MTFGEMLKLRREELGLGLRELSRLTEGKPNLTLSFSPSYYSPIERNSENVIVSKIGIDILWAIGYALKINPNSLFAITRRIENILVFKIKNCKHSDISNFIRARREELGLSLQDVVEEIERRMSKEILKKELTVSRSYLNQIENNIEKIRIPKIEGDVIWALGVGYDIDPLLLYVLSRGLDSRLKNFKERQKLFPEELELSPLADSSQTEYEKFIFLEGQKLEFDILRSKRNSKVSKIRKELDKYTCRICDFKFKFKNKYVIECHHLTPLLMGVRETTIDDLISVCPTCHQIFHLTNPPLKGEEVKQKNQLFFRNRSGFDS